MVSRVVREDLRLSKTLRETGKQYFELKGDRAETAVYFYRAFLKDHIFTFKGYKEKVAKDLKYFFEKDPIKIVAIDGTKYERSRRGCIVFYVLAAPLVYELHLSPIIKIKRVEEETVRNNVMVLMPVPWSEIFLLGESMSQIESSEEGEEKIEEELGDFFTPQKIGRIDTVLMKLAEVYTAYWCIKNVKPDVIMMDGSLFQDYSFSNRSIDKLSIWKGEVLGFKFTKEDFMILKSYPINAELKIPSPVFVREFITAELLVAKKIEVDRRSLKYRSSF